MSSLLQDFFLQSCGGQGRGEFSTLTTLSVHAEASDVVVITIAKLCLLPIQLILLERGSLCTLLATVLQIKRFHGCDYVIRIKQTNKKS